MSRFPAPGHLVPGAKFAPRARQCARRSKAATTGTGNPWPGGTPGEAAISAARTKTFLASRYKPIVRRRGKQRALVAAGNSLLTIVWHPLSTPPLTSPASALTGTTASPRYAANASSSPNSNACPATRSPSTTPPDTTSRQPRHLARTRLR
jgi:hypothetical protein